MLHEFKTSDSYVLNELKKYRKPVIEVYAGSSIAMLIFGAIFQSFMFLLPIVFFTLVTSHHYIKFKRNLLKSDRVKNGMVAQVNTSTNTLTLDCGEASLSTKLLEVKNISIDKFSSSIIETHNGQRVVVGGYENQEKLNSLLSVNCL
ncbi:hypothetical protein HWV00_12205 [Moritella sp. 24]|uniref:hypothetical protein n=1 Tax=Moritella sp. 24 TaxID=2746230 RepID=UPI001BABDC80|nr:hypothetical protein [Moritella sp. 24]QUM76940.1 hypothetical protein HWV00_12205 [Moritella sp. 24]